MEMTSPEPKPKKGAGRRGVPGQSGSQQRKEDENQAWLAMLEKATSSVRYISRHIKKEHFIREVWERADMTDSVGWMCFSACCVTFNTFTLLQPTWNVSPDLICCLQQQISELCCDLAAEYFHCEHTWSWKQSASFCLSCSACLSVSSVSLALSGCTRLEVCGSGVGQDLPLGLPHGVNTGNSSHLHPCSADVPQLTMNTHTNTLQKLLIPVLQFVLSYNLLIMLNKTFPLYISIVGTSSSCKPLPPYSSVCSL